MARKAREYCESNLYNAGIKGHNSQLLFFDDEDRLRFLRATFLACEEFEVGLAAWVLMSNHTHFLFHNEIKSLPSFFKSLGASYSQWLRSKYSTSGEIWGGRYFAKGIESAEEYSQVAAYIFNNPVYARITSDAREYEWSNFNEICLGYDEDAIKLINSITDVNQIINLTKIKAQKKLSKEMKERLEVFPKARVPDDILISAVKGTVSIEDLIQAYVLPEEQQRCIVNLLLNNGASINQVSRITGISRRWIAAFTED